MKFGKRPLNPYKVPNRRRKLLTLEFLKTFKKELDMRIEAAEEEDATYWGHYFHIESTNEFYEAFIEACRIHNLTKALYYYCRKLPKDHLKEFDDTIVLAMVEKGLIKEGDIWDGIPDYDCNNTKYFTFIERVRECKGYNVISTEWLLKEKEIIEYDRKA